MGFERFADKESGREFLYNKSTGETKWIGGKGVINLSEVDSIVAEKVLQGDAAAEGTTTTTTNTTDVSQGSDSSSSVDDCESQALVSPKMKSVNNNPQLLGDSSHTPVKNSTSLEDRSPVSTTKKVRRMQEQNRTITTFRFCLTCHTCFCEGPMAVAEGMLKSVLYLVFALMLLILYVASEATSRENENGEQSDEYCYASSLRSSFGSRAVIAIIANSLRQQRQVRIHASTEKEQLVV